MYYTGTKKECSEYNSVVKNALKYRGEEEGWGTVIKHPSKSKYAVEKHESFSNAGLTKVESLSEDWFSTEEK
jgi:hypothetical protein